MAATPRSLHFAWDPIGRQRMFHALIAITSPTHSLGRKIEPATFEALPFAMLVGDVKTILLLLGVNVGVSRRGVGVVVRSLFHFDWRLC